MRRIVRDAHGLGQKMAVRIIELAQRVIDQGNSITVRWTLAHRGVERNERADRAAKDAASLPPSGPRVGTSAYSSLRGGPLSGPPRYGEKK